MEYDEKENELKELTQKQFLLDIYCTDLVKKIT